MPARAARPSRGREWKSEPEQIDLRRSVQGKRARRFEYARGLLYVEIVLIATHCQHTRVDIMVRILGAWLCDLCAAWWVISFVKVVHFRISRQLRFSCLELR